MGSGIQCAVQAVPGNGSSLSGLMQTPAVRTCSTHQLASLHKLHILHRKHMQKRGYT